jgi:hypothetical protein
VAILSTSASTIFNIIWHLGSGIGIIQATVAFSTYRTSHLRQSLRGFSEVAEEVVAREILGGLTLNVVANIMYLVILVVVVPKAHCAKDLNVRGTFSAGGFIPLGYILVGFNEASHVLPPCLSYICVTVLFLA